MKILGHPENKFPSFHIAGTNGKGSTSHMLASILQAEGYKVGLYTSPHLLDFRERIRINGKLISKKEVIEFIEQYQNQINNIKLSFFELTVGMAFSAFEKAQVDIAIIEVGMGGRLDSTNVITPMVSVITNIDLSSNGATTPATHLLQSNRTTEAVVRVPLPMKPNLGRTETSTSRTETWKQTDISKE